MRVILLCAGVAACSGGKVAATTSSSTDAAGAVDSTGSSSGTGDGSAGGAPDAGMAGPAVGPLFTKPMFWNQDVSAVAKSGTSDAVIAGLAAAGGWGNSNTMQIDFSIEVLTADGSAPHETFTENGDWASPDCDDAAVPVPAGGNLEGNPGYACNDGGDCHLLVDATAEGKLYEVYEADIEGSSFTAGCLAVWNLGEAYGDSLRGDQCTSADAAGYPIAPLLFTADEVASGHIDHAIRFILPNNRVRRGFTRPATHGSSTTGGTATPPYGVHLRLRSDYPIDSLPSEGAKVVARAMQKYGMYHADGGNIALTARSDARTTAKWSGLLDSHDLSALKVSDFEVIDHGSMIPLTYDCVRN
jgi:serine/threonine-protein kinase